MGEGGREPRGGGKDDRTNGASDLRRECLRKTYPACINREAAERTEMRVKTLRATQRGRQPGHNVQRVCTWEPPLSG